MVRRRIGAVTIGLTLMCAPAASADVLDVYSDLARLDASTPPLVPTVAPASLPLDQTIEGGGTRREYSIRLARPNAVVLLTGGQFKSMAAVFRDARRQSATSRKTRIRGRRGYLFTRRSGPTSRTLAWVERGVVYTLSSGTPRRVSLTELRRTAAGLEPVGASYLGSSSDPDSGTSGVAVTTQRTVTLHLDFQANCAAPGSPYPSIRAGSTSVTLLKREGDSFAFDIDDSRQREWEGTVSGTVSPSAITLDVRPRGTFDGNSCSGAETLTLERRG
jgi:hypothetical protein